MLKENTPEKTDRVLVVDDDPILRKVIGGALTKSGFHVDIASNGKEALEVFDQKSPDIVLMDVEMPIMDGFSALHAIQSRPDTRHTPVVMLTSLNADDAVHRAYESGATDFITKPVNLALLVHRLRYILRTARLFRDLNENKKRLAAAQRVAHIGNWEWDLKKDHFHCAETLWKMLGQSPKAPCKTAKDFLRAVHPADRGQVKKVMDTAIKNKSPYSIEHRVLTHHDVTRIVHAQAEVTLDSAGNVTRLFGMIQDITERKKADEKIRNLAYYDPLTHLPNRGLLQEYLDQAIQHARRSQRNVGILLIDLDRFKQINDTLGHSVGDHLLKKVARRLETCIRANGDSIACLDSESIPGVVSRFGGDEFLILLSNLKNAEDAEIVSRRILLAFNVPFETEHHEFRITPSIGISIYPKDGEDPETLIKNSDTAMYHAKEKGRNNFQNYVHTMNLKSLKKLRLESDLRKALDRNQFRLHFQPKVNIQTGKIVGAEGLLRWEHPEKGPVSPNEFIPIAEESGLILPMGEWVFSTACLQQKAWQADGFEDIHVAVNLSFLQLRQHTFVQTVQNILDAIQPNAARLELELTESVIMQNAEGTVNLLHRIKKMGIRLSVDDFGTGYSSLSYLKRFPIDTLKIDRSFVRDIATDPDDAAIVQAIIAMAKSLKLKVIAEGVETARQLAFLGKHGCHEMQGFYFSKALSAEDFTQLLKQERALSSSESHDGENAAAHPPGTIFPKIAE